MPGWPNLSELIVKEAEGAKVGLLGAPLSAGSVTPGDCGSAPQLLRDTLRRIGRYDADLRHELSTHILDNGDLPIEHLSIEDATAPIREGVAKCSSRHELTLVVGGNNAVTRPAALGLGMSLERVGLITLDAHFDMRELDQGLGNGNPIRALIEDGMPGSNIAQVGIASFANSRKMHDDALLAGNLIVTIEEVRRHGIAAAIDKALAQVSHCDAILVDCDIDVVDRSQFPAAPGSRAGGMQVVDFFAAVRRLAQESRVRVIDLTEWDPPLDATDLSALTAGRWLAECLAGFEMRS
jgi:arginase family enzyme